MRAWPLLLLAFAPAPDSKYLVTDLKGERTASYVVIAADALVENCDALLAHREQAGQKVALVRMSDVGRIFGEGKPTSDAIIAFLKHAATRWGARFALLAGDADGVPACARRSEYQTTRFANDEDLGSDQPYAAAGVAVGRFPADTAAELASMIEKTIEYEKRAPPGPWQRRISFITGEGGFGAIVDSFIEAEFTKIVTGSVPAGYEIELAYAKPSSPYCPHPAHFNDNVIRLLNEGALFFVYVGHGKRTGCDSIEFRDRFYPILEEEHVKAVRVRAGRPVMVVIACNTGEFDARTGDCIGESLMKSPTGPVAFIGGSRVTQPYGNALLGRALVDACLRRKATLGEALVEARQRVLEPDDSSFRKTADRVAGLIQGSDALEPMRKDVGMHYNLLGDPALVLRRPAEAVEFDVKADGRRIAIQGRSTLKDGRALVSVDCARDKFLRPPVRIPSGDPDLAARLLDRYRAANDKSVARAEVAVRGGSFEVEFALPAGVPAGTYTVRALAWDDAGAAMAARELQLAE